MTQEHLTELFKAWWQESYGMPPITHATMTHVAFGMHLLDKLQQEDADPESAG